MEFEFPASDRGEEWRRVVGYPEYIVSSHGRIYHSCKKWYPKVNFNSDGYKILYLRRKKKFVHRVLAEAFMGSLKGRKVTHINKNRGWNLLNNLRIIEQYEQV